MNESKPPGEGENHAESDQDDEPISDVVVRAQLKAAFSADTPDGIRDRILDAVLAVLNGEDDD